ncbi:permease [Clostridium thailandense]
MLLLAYVLCICSQTDAFIARAFLGQFTVGSIIGFLIFGPMLDIKNTLMLTGTFNRKFTIKLIFLIIAVCFIMAIVANYAIPISLKFSGGF